jgi:hypothetical protein
MGKLDKVTSKNFYLRSSNPILTEYLRFLVRKKLVEDSRNKTGRFNSVFDTALDLNGILGDEVSDDPDDNQTPGLAKTPGLSQTPGFFRRLSLSMGGKTPGLGSKTPGMSSKTPGLGRKTPGWSILRESFSKTPGLGSKTPGLGGQDSRISTAMGNSRAGSRVGMFRPKSDSATSEKDEEDEEISEEYRQILVDYVIGGTRAKGDFDNEVKIILIII